MRNYNLYEELSAHWYGADNFDLILTYILLMLQTAVSCEIIKNFGVSSK